MIHVNRVVSSAAAIALLLSGSGLMAASPAAAAPAGLVVNGLVMPSATPLPTTQIDGVAWQQIVVGDTVYVGGNFTTARPYGAPAGTDTVARANMLAYDINTGALKTDFVANTNGQVLGLTMSPDGSRLYISGEFTSVNGQTRYRLAAVDPVTGALDPSFRPQTDYRVRSIVATANAVYVGGSFSSAGGQPRTNLAAFRPSDGAVLDWAPTALNGQVMAIAMSPGNDKIVVAGAFNLLNGTTARGLGAVDPVTGALVPYATNQVVANSGSAAAIYSLTTDDSGVYGSGYTFGSGGNLEGNFAADPSGDLRWINDIHGDQYDVHAARGMVFSVGHAHADGNIDGGFPQGSPSVNHTAIVQTAAAAGTVAPTTTGYANFGGRPSPTLLHWFPEYTQGTYTASNQASWAITGNDTYIVTGGEFTAVNGVPQQGLVRFVFSDKDPVSTQAPRRSAADFTPLVSSPASGVAQISWLSNWDRDDEELTYNVQREGAGTIATYTGKSTFWNLPVITHLDRDLAPGSTARYRIIATDSRGNRAIGDYVEVTISDAGSISDYRQQVLADRPKIYFRMDEASGANLADSAYIYGGGVTTGTTRGVPGALTTEPGNTATRFSGSAQSGSPATNWTAVKTFSTESWVKTTTTRGGLITGFVDKIRDNSSNRDYMTYMRNDGRINFGVYENSRKVITSPAAYNDGKWHHVVSTLDWANGARLYVDGLLVASNPGIRHGLNFNGFWRIGGDTLASWPNTPTSGYLAGDIDEVAVYANSIGADRVLAHYRAGGGQVPNQAPTANFTWGNQFLRATLDGSTSTDLEGPISTWSWQFGDGNTGTGMTVEHEYQAAGTYTVTLTVTDAGGLTATRTGTVTVTDPPPNQDPTASFLSVADFLKVSVDASASADSDGTISAYSWDFGDGATGTGVTASHDYTEAGTYTITLTVTDNRGGTDTKTSEVTVVAQPPNVVPVAGFTAQVSKMGVAVDAATSTDSDGSIVSYGWDFGDGNTGTGVTANHTYTDPGTYTITLTVTDDRGGVDTETTQVTAVANQAPQAAFTTTTDLLAVAVDATTSTDADGQITGYQWDFGDGTTGTGVATNHTYPNPGTYTITLTVTDNDATTATTTSEVTVTTPTGLLASDDFARNVATGWGTAPLGGPWSNTGSAANYSVSDGTGHMTMGTAGAKRETSLNLNETDVDLTTTVIMDRAQTGSGTYVSIGARRNGTTAYAARLRFLADRSVQLHNQRVINGTATSINGGTLPGLTYTAGEKLNLRIQVTGTNPTTIRTKVWRTGDPEPTTWNYTSTDTTTELQGPGRIYFESYLSASSTTAMTMQIDDVRVTQVP